MKKQTKIKNGFYKGFISEQQKPKEPHQPKEQIVIVNQKEKDGFLKVLFTAVGAVFRFIIYVVLFGLSSVGLTALLNKEISELLKALLIS